MSQVGLGSILKGNTLRVPPHQREYSWTEKEVKKLFQDLTKAISDQPEYFLGTVSTIREGTGALKVIDGQQRLATVMILICEIRNYLRSINDQFLVDSLKDFLEYPDREQRMTLPKLKLNTIDHEFFCQMLTSPKKDRPAPTGRFSHRLIAEAFEEAESHVKKIVSSLSPRDHSETLNKWISYLEDSAEVILLKMPVGYNAYKMFETLNDRGLGTTQADMVKSYLFEQAESNDRLAEAESYWSLIRGALDALQDDKDISVIFIRHALILIHGPITKDEILDVVQVRAKGAGAAISVCKQLETLAKTYTSTFFSDHENWAGYPDAIKHAVQTLNFFNIQPFRPAMLAIAEKFDKDATIAAYEIMISLGVRIMIASSTSSGSVESVLYKAAHEIYSGKITTAKQFRGAIDAIFPSDEKFKAAFSVATVSKAPLARYYLRTLDRAHKNEPTPWFNINDDKEVINLEHILPANPDGNYPEFSAEDVSAYWRRLGNMALQSKKINSDDRSEPFEKKKAGYHGCPYKLTSQLATVTGDWTKNLIKERQETMAEIALKAWPS